MNGIHIQHDRLIVNNAAPYAKEKRVDFNRQKQWGWVVLVKTWIARNRHCQELLSKPDYLLKDIGVTREEIIKESNTPFWKSGILQQKRERV